MLGEGIEENGVLHDGLGMLPVHTSMQPRKMVRRVSGVTPSGHEFQAYEIHMGSTRVVGDAAAFAYVAGYPEGARVERCFGTYLHGALENPGVCAEIGLPFQQTQSREKQYEALAKWFESNVDVKLFEELYL
jgi:adenosylcobyric acid synthase